MLIVISPSQIDLSSSLNVFFFLVWFQIYNGEEREKSLKIPKVYLRSIIVYKKLKLIVIHVCHVVFFF